MREQLRVGSVLCWTVAWLLAVAAPVLYLVAPGDVTWWLAPALALPLLVLAAWRHEARGLGDDGHPGGMRDGPILPPSDHLGGS